MLPEILEVAEQHQLIINPRTHGKKETTAKCPFCHEDAKPDKKHKYYLSLNTENQVFKCWYCGQSGGVYRFISLLEDIPESEVVERYQKQFGKRRVHLHPVERLTANQFKLMGYRNKPNWFEMRKRDKSYYKRTRDLIWSEWKEFMQREKYQAFQLLIAGIYGMSYQKSVQRIKEREKEIGVPLLEHVLKIYPLSERPEWTERAKKFALHVCNPIKYPFEENLKLKESV